MTTTDEHKMSKTAELLQNVFDKDPNAIHALVTNRVPCNQLLVDDPFAIVTEALVVQENCLQIGTMGITSAVLAANGLPLIAYKLSD